MFLSLLLSEWVLQSPAHSRTHPVCFCLDYASWQLGYFGDCFFLYHLFCIFLHLNMVCISCQSTMESLSNLHVYLLQLYLSRLGFSQTAQCSLESSSSGTPPLPAASHLAMAVLNSAWEQPQSDTPVLLALPNSSKMRPTAIRIELAGPKRSRPSKPDRSSRVTAMPLACSPHHH